MKKFFYLFMCAAMSCTTTVFTSCSDDDNTVTIPIAEELAGNYKGQLKVNVDGTDLGTQSQKISVEKAGEQSINLSLTDFSFIGIKIGDVELKDCQLTKNGDSYSFTGTTSLNVDILKADINATGTIGANKVEVNMDIAADLNGTKQTVKVVYTGDKLKGDESSEAKITKFVFDKSNESNSIVIEQPVINDDNTIVFRVREDATDEQLLALVPSIEVSDKAVLSSTDINFLRDVTYNVEAEDGTISVYILKKPLVGSVIKYSFDEWISVGSDNNKHDEPLPKEELASSVEGAQFLLIYGVKGFPVYKTDDAVQGNAIKLITMDVSDKANSLVPAITAGSVYTGKFDLGAIFIDRLKTTKFGIPYTKKPLLLKGWYKYIPGEKFIDGSDFNNIKPLEKTDECIIQAVLYEAKDADGKEVTLTGHDINDSKYRVAVAELKDGSSKKEYTQFALPFEYINNKEYNKDMEYKIAVICSSSKEGDLFKGAGGSTLIVDELELVGE